MKLWYKYRLGKNGAAVEPMDQSFSAHASAMGGYELAPSCLTRDDFFNTYFFGYHRGRLEHYDLFINEQLTPPATILSIGSGMSANELKLMGKGFLVTCSDLEPPASINGIQELFSRYNFVPLDILAGPASEQSDHVLALSLIYLFDADQFSLFLRNVSESLKTNGHLILDSAGAPDNLAASLWHDVFLLLENHFLKIIKKVRHGDDYEVCKKHFGFRRSDKNILESAVDNGFRLVRRKAFPSLADFRRSQIFNKFVPEGHWTEKTFLYFSRFAPYTRLFDFEKVEPI